MILLKDGTIITDDFGSSEWLDMLKIVRHYDGYETDIQAIKDAYNDETIRTRGINFLTAIEFILLRLREAQNQHKWIEDRKQYQETPSRELETELTVFENAKHLLERYSDNKKGADMVKLLNGCISDISKIQSGMNNKNDIRFGYNNCLHILNKRANYLDSKDSFKTKATNLQLKLLLEDLDEREISYHKGKVTELFKNYLDNI